jgi:N utilization substance protein B
MKKRRKSRELVLQGLYAWEISENPIEAILEDINRWCENDEEIAEFASNLLKKTISEKESLDQYVSSMVKNWEFKRIALIDRIILRAALCELLYFETIPPKVTLNEAIDLAKKYSTSESGRFVNGILDALYKKLHAEKKIIKKGRGLIE